MKPQRNAVTVSLTSLVMVITLLSACGTSNPSNSSSGTAGNTSASGSSSEAVTLRLTTWGSPAEQAAWKAQATRFEEAQAGKIKVDVQGIPTDYDTKLTTMVAGGQEPDVAEMESGSIAYPLAEEDRFLDLKPFIDADPDLSADKLVPNIIYYLDGEKVIGVGPGPETFVLFYNEDMFRDAGVTPPPSDASKAWTWSTLR